MTAKLTSPSRAALESRPCKPQPNLDRRAAVGGCGPPISRRPARRSFRGDIVKYESEKADALDMYVSRAVPLRGPARHLYFAIRRLEIRRNVGLCRLVFAPYDDLADEAAIDRKSVKNALVALQQLGLISLRIGTPIKGGRDATEIRRSTLDEIKARSRVGDDAAERLATALTGRALRFHDRTVRPTWNVSLTGRVCSSSPDIQGKKPADRATGLAAGLTQGFVLVHADIRQAEPGIVKHLLGFPVERDLYAQYMKGAGCDRDEAKRRLNALQYCANTIAYFRHWPSASQDALRDYVEALAEYKAALFAQARKSRCVTTCTGRTIFAEKAANKRLHAGRVLNWRVQGTVADIINAASLDILACTKVLVPVHDSIYAILAEADAGTVASSIETHAWTHGLPSRVRVEITRAQPGPTEAPDPRQAPRAPLAPVELGGGFHHG